MKSSISVRTNTKKENKIYEFLLEKKYTKKNPLVFRWNEKIVRKSIYEACGEWPDLPLITVIENHNGLNIINMGGITRMYAVKSQKKIRIGIKFRAQKQDRYGWKFLDFFEKETINDLCSVKRSTKDNKFEEDLHTTISYDLTLSELKKYIKTFAL